MLSGQIGETPPKPLSKPTRIAIFSYLRFVRVIPGLREGWLLYPDGVHVHAAVRGQGRMEPERACPRCGRKIPWGQTECPFCSERQGYFWSFRRDTFLALVFGALVVLFAVTDFTVRRYRATQAGLAQHWYTFGEAALESGNAARALGDFRNALIYSRDNPLFQLRLGQSLAATGSLQEARTCLLSLRERELGNGPVNLELARLAAREHATSEAVQYYHDAVYSEWEGDAAGRRRAVRLELVNFLLATGQKAAARAELIGVAGNLPPNAELRTEVGELLMKAGAYDDALNLFRQALALQPRSAHALAGAGGCYFLTGEYMRAELYLNRALHQDPKLAQVAAMRDTARAVLDLDPFMRWLGEQQREQRTRRALNQAMTRLQACAAQRSIDLQAAGPSPLPRLYAEATTLEASMQQPARRRDAEWLSNTMDLVFDMERAASQACGEPHGPDLALLLIAREQIGAQQ